MLHDGSFLIGQTMSGIAGHTCTQQLILFDLLCNTFQPSHPLLPSTVIPVCPLERALAGLREHAQQPFWPAETAEVDAACRFLDPPVGRHLWLAAQQVKVLH